jgi:hypothetical protein
VARRHHQVSEFYLKYFAGHDPQGSRHLWVYDKAAKTNPRPQTPKNTNVERGYYSFDTIKGEDERLEFMLGELEGEASPILANLQESGASLDHSEIGFLAEFLALLYLRVPKTCNAMIEHKQIEAFEAARMLSTRRDLLKRFSEDKHPVVDGRSVSEEELAEILRTAERDFRVEVDRKAALIDCIKMASTLAELLYRMNWIICDAPANSHFVTSDAPVCVYLPTGPGRAVLGAGFGHPEVQISFPVSPKVLLLLDWQHGRERHYRVRAKERFTHEMNKRMAWNAERFLVSSIRDPRVQTLLERAKVTASQPKLDRVSYGALISKRLATAFDKL